VIGLILKEKKKVASSVVCLFEFYGRSTQLIKFVLDEEIRTAEVTTLFREDKMSFRIVSHYIRFVSLDWIKSIVAPIISSLKGSVCYEVNPHKLVNPKKEKPKNSKNLQKLAQNIFDSILKHQNSVPQKLRMVASIVFKKVKKTFNGQETNGLGVMLFLRFICPALCLPKESGIIDQKINLHPNVTRGLILVAKVLQNLSLNIRFNKDTWMYDLDEFIGNNYESMKNFLMSMVSNEKTKATGIESTNNVSKMERENAKEVIFEEIKKYKINL